MAKVGKNTGRSGAPKAPPKPADSLRQLAHHRLDQLWSEAEATDFYGDVGVIATFEAGSPRTLRRKLDGTDK